MKDIISNGELFTIHKEAGKLRETCRFVTCKNDIPAFLIDSGAVSVDGNNITMIAVEGSATRSFPVFLSWEESEKTESGYGAWPKDNGFTTLIVDENGNCFDKAPNYTAALIVHGKPLHEHFAKNGSIKIVGNECQVHTSWGEIRKVPMPKDENDHVAVLIDYGNGSVNLLTLSEKSAAEYIVVNDNGEDVGRLTDIIS